MNRTRRLAIGLTAFVTSAGLALGGATAAQAHDQGNGPLSSLVTEGTLTSAEVTAVKDALKSAHEAGRAEHQVEKRAAREAALATLVAEGTLTQAQATAIAEADRGDMRELVANGTITREQLRALAIALKADLTESRENHRAERDADVAAVVASLVSNGTLTQAKADAVKAALADHPGRDGTKRGKGGLGGDR
jgi:competence protein ComGC